MREGDNLATRGRGGREIQATEGWRDGDAKLPGGQLRSQRQAV